MFRTLQGRLVGLHDRPVLTGIFDSDTETCVPAPDTHQPCDALLSTCANVPRASSVREAVRWTVAYASIFDFPLTRDEIYQFLIAPGGSRAEVDAAIDEELIQGTGLEANGLFLYPPGQSGMVTTRLRRGNCAREAWRHARFYAWLIWTLPYVRMVAVTGSLAMDNVEQGDDIDLMIITEPNRLWITRAMILVVVKLARVHGHVLCPNYIISSRALALQQRDPYAAHELVQMAPIYGRQAARRLWMENAWYRDFLPNAWWRDDERVDDRIPWILMASKALAEAILRLPPGTWIERWEQRRKIAKLLRGAPHFARETLYTADVCKGHVDSHGSQVMNMWMARVRVQVDQHDLQM